MLNPLYIGLMILVACLFIEWMIMFIQQNRKFSNTLAKPKGRPIRS